MSAEVRSRLVNAVADAIAIAHSQGAVAALRAHEEAEAEVAVRTVCDLIADEIETLNDHDFGPPGDVEYRRARDEAAALVRSLGQP